MDKQPFSPNHLPEISQGVDLRRHSYKPGRYNMQMGLAYSFPQIINELAAKQRAVMQSSETLTQVAEMAVSSSDETSAAAPVAAPTTPTAALSPEQQAQQELLSRAYDEIDRAHAA